MDNFKKKLLGDTPFEPSILSFEDDLNIEAVGEDEAKDLRRDNKKYSSMLQQKVSTRINKGAESSKQRQRDSDDIFDEDTPEYEYDNPELAMIKKQLGLPERGVYKTRIDIKRDSKFRPVEEPRGMTEEELMLFKAVVAPAMIKNTDPFGPPRIDFTYIQDELEDDDTEMYDREMTAEEESVEEKKLMEMIMNTRRKIVDLNRAERQIQKIVEDERYVTKQQSKKNKKHDLYSDLKFFKALQIFNTKWKNAILNDQNVEIPFLYLNSLQTAGIGGVPYNFRGAVFFLESLGMTVDVVSETVDSCRYKAFFSGRQTVNVSDDEITMLKEMIKENERKKPPRFETGSSAAQTSYNIPENTYKALVSQETGERGIEALKKAEWLGGQHLRPNSSLVSTPHTPTEKEKERKKKENIMHMHTTISKTITVEDELDDEEYPPKQLQEDEDNYDAFLGGFTKEMLESLEQSSKYLDMRAQDSLAKKQTELSAWIEKHLCINIMVVPGITSEDTDATSIERQLMFMFNLSSQNPYTFYFMNIGMEERKNALMKEKP